MTTPEARRCAVLNLIGDSHVLALGDRVFDAQGAPCLVRARYLPGFAASRLRGDRALDPALADALGQLDLLDDRGVPRHLLMTPEHLAIAYAAVQPQLPPVVALSAAEIDVRARLLEPLRGHDVLLPPGSPFPGVNPERELVPLELVQERVEECLAGLEASLKHMTERGLRLTALLAVPPPTTRDETFERVNGYRASRRLHAKLVWLMNRALEALCQRTEVAFVDPGPELVDAEGMLRAEFELDGVHLGPAAVDLQLGALWRAVCAAALRFVHLPRYGLLRDQAPRADAASGPAAERVAEFQARGLCRLEVSREVVSALRGPLEFAHEARNRHARFGWAGNPTDSALPHLLTSDAEPILEPVHALLYGPEVAPTIRGCLGRDFVVLNCRPVRSLPHTAEGEGPQQLHHDACPPGVLRVILYLTDVGEASGPFEYRDGDARRTVVGPAGTLFVFDADRLWHRGRPPERGAREVLDLIVAPRAEGMPQLVIAAGMNNWPCDPFAIPLRGLQTYPPTGDALFTRPEPGRVDPSYAPPRVEVASDAQPASLDSEESPSPSTVRRVASGARAWLSRRTWPGRAPQP